MKYSLRTLLIVVTLVCVLLGTWAGRVEYLRRWAAFHDEEGYRHFDQWRQEYELTKRSGSASEAHKWEVYLHHKALAIGYREAMNRPWTTVDETPVP